MTVVVITKGAHYKSATVTPDSPPAPRKLAHMWDVDCPEDLHMQVDNFLSHVRYVGDHDGFVLYAPGGLDDSYESQLIRVQLAEFATNVRTATGIKVEVK